MITISGFIFKGLTNTFHENTKFSNKVNSIYQQNIDNKDFNRCRCSKCNSTGDFEIKGYYYRNIVIDLNKISLRVTRIKCNSCNATHALFFEDIIPYFCLTSFDSLSLYLADFISAFYDYDLLHRLKNRFSQFIKYLNSVNESISKIHDINLKTIPSMSKSYLQIHVGFISFCT